MLHLELFPEWLNPAPNWAWLNDRAIRVVESRDGRVVESRDGRVVVQFAASRKKGEQKRLADEKV